MADPKPWVMRRHDREPANAPRSAFPDFDEPEWFDRENSADWAPRPEYGPTPHPFADIFGEE